MESPYKLYDNLRIYTSHKNKEFSIKSLEVLISLMGLFVRMILIDKKKYRNLFNHIRDKIAGDLNNIYSVRPKDQEGGEEINKGFNLITVVRMIGLMAPLYL
jgi:hypothetical protein